MSLRDELIEAGATVIASFDGWDAIDGENGVANWSSYQDDAAKVLDAMLSLLKEHDRKQRKMEWPFSFSEYMKMLEGEDHEPA